MGMGMGMGMGAASDHASPGFSKFFLNTFAKIRSRITRSSNASRSQHPSLPDGLHRRFSLAEIRAATNDLSRDSLIGFGVYKGLIDNGSLLVAVKRLVPHHASTKLLVSEFRTEVLLLCQLRHPQIVALIGFCEEDGDQILVYEYMSGGGFDRHLFNPDKRAELHWKRRLEICIGVAHALRYLHTGLKRVVIHRDIRTSNILIDGVWGAKLSGFALSKLGPNTLSQKPLVFKKDTEGIVGTFGYIAPEVIDGEMSTRSDVFAFGVVLLEVLAGRRVRDYCGNNLHLIPWCGENVKNETWYEIVDPFMRGKIAPECLRIFLEMADSCLAMEADERPIIGEVAATLELVLEQQSKADHNSEVSYKEEPFAFPADSSNLVRWYQFSSNEVISTRSGFYFS